MSMLKDDYISYYVHDGFMTVKLTAKEMTKNMEFNILSDVNISSVSMHGVLHLIHTDSY